MDGKELEKTLKDNQAVIAVVPSEEYADTIVEIAKKLSKRSLCYVTLNKTYQSLQEIFKKKNVNTDNIIFIDAISRSLKQTPDQSDAVYFVSSPGSTTELSITISKFLKHNFEYMIFDSLSTLAIYEKKEPIVKFMSILVNRIKESNTKAVFYALDLKENDDLLKQCSMFVDDIVKFD